MLADYVAGHFLREEKALQAAKYPHLEEHRQKHHAFRIRIMKIVNDYSEGKNEDLRNLPGLVVNWLRQHIFDEDMQYKGFIEAKFVDKRPLAFLAAEAEDTDELENIKALGRK
jgi:hemerythrin